MDIIGSTSVKLGACRDGLSQDGTLMEGLEQFVRRGMDSLLVSFAQIDREGLLLIQGIVIHPSAARLLEGKAAEVPDQYLLDFAFRLPILSVLH